jgi:hypothetical protein
MSTIFTSMRSLASHVTTTHGNPVIIDVQATMMLDPAQIGAGNDPEDSMVDGAGGDTWSKSQMDTRHLENRCHRQIKKIIKTTRE